jgi:nucleoside-diphosphate-sugar epimerase
MKLLITGAGGFLGSEVVRVALADGHEVRALIRHPRHRQQFAPTPTEVVLCNLAAEGLPDSLKKLLDEALEGAVEGIEAVIHCAAATAATGASAADAHAINVDGTRRLLEASRRAGVGRWVQISSMSAHPGSTSIYGTTKLAADRLLRESPAQAPPAWTILRPSLIYGPGTLGLVAKTIGIARKLPVLPILGAGRETMRPVYVTDVAQGILRCLGREATFGQTYMLGGADEVTVDRFMRLLLSRAGLRRPVVHLPLPVCMALARLLSIPFKNPPITVDNVLGVREAQPVDHQSAMRDWGWLPIGLDEGLRRTFA